MEDTNTDALKEFFNQPPEKKDPIAEAFKTFLKSKNRYWQPKTARQIFTAGYLAAQAALGPVKTVVETTATNETVETAPVASTEVAGT